MRSFARFFAAAAALPTCRPHRRRPARAVEPLESRTLFALALAAEIPNTAVAPGTNSSAIDLSPHFDDPEISGTVVRLATDMGNIDIELFDDAAPATVANFLGYVNRGDYNNTFFHRSVPGFVVQGGGFKVNEDLDQITTHIPTVSPVQNEFSPSRSNRRETVAMAKLPAFDDTNRNGVQDPGEQPVAGGGPDSATSEFFFNLEDNGGTPPFGLDHQNGGFTVFARVLNRTMSVVDAIAGLPTTDARFTGLPVNGPLPLTADDLVEVTNAAVMPESGIYNYTVTSSNPELVTGGVDRGVLRLNYGSGQTGVAEITVTATDAAGVSVTDTFRAGVGVLDVAVGNGGAKAVTFTDADGTVATVSLKGAAGTVRVSGVNLSETTGKAGSTVAGTITDLSITLTGGGTSGALAVRASGGDGRVNLNSMTADGGLKSIGGKQLNVVGNVTIAGAVGKADFADVTNSIMNFGGSGGGGLALSLLNANAVDINAQTPIKSLKAASFTGGGPDVGAITAPALGSLQVTGDFNQRLNIAGPLGSVKIGGAAGTFLPWNVGGGAGKLAFGSTSEGFVADFLGGVASLAVAGNLTGDIATPFLKSLTVKGDMTNANLTLTGGGAALGKATISGAIATSRIQAMEGIGTVTAGRVESSTIYAGLTTDGGILPTSLADFNPGPSSIKSLTVKGAAGAPSFVNSNVAARTLGKLTLGVVQVGNDGVPFGVAGDTIASLAGTGLTGIKLAKLSEPSQTQTQQEFTVAVL